MHISILGGRFIRAVLLGVVLLLGWGGPLGALANVVGTDAQNFNPTTNGLDFVTVQSSETLKPGYVNFGLFGNYAYNSLPRFGTHSDQTDHLFSSDLNFGIGLLKNWDAGISFPAVLGESVESTGFRGSYSKTGFTEIKVNTKYRFFGDDSGGFALVPSVNFNLIENNPYVGENSKPIYNLEAVFDHSFGDIATGINVGYRWRRPGTPISVVPVQPIKNQWIGSVAASYYFSKLDTKLIGEVFGAVPASPSKTSQDSQDQALEALLGIKHDLNENLALHSGVGRKLASGVSSPDIRVYVGLNLALGPKFKQQDETPELEAVREPEPEELESPITPQPEPALPKAMKPVLIAEDTIRLRTRAIRFDFDRADLKPSARPILADLVKYLNAINYKSITIEGHTDSVGQKDYNQSLSERRANTIRNELVRVYHLDPRTVLVVGYGDTRPVADNGNYQGREQNRRVEFNIER